MRIKMEGRILENRDIFEEFSKNKICVFVKPINENKREEIAKSLGIDDLEKIFSFEYYMKEFLDKNEAYKYLMTFREKFRDDLYACLYINGKFEDEHT